MHLLRLHAVEDAAARARGRGRGAPLARRGRGGHGRARPRQGLLVAGSGRRQLRRLRDGLVAAGPEGRPRARARPGCGARRRRGGRRADRVREARPGDRLLGGDPTHRGARHGRLLDEPRRHELARDPGEPDRPRGGPRGVRDGAVLRADGDAGDDRRPLRAAAAARRSGGGRAARGAVSLRGDRAAVRVGRAADRERGRQDPHPPAGRRDGRRREAARRHRPAGERCRRSASSSSASRSRGRGSRSTSGCALRRTSGRSAT